MTYMVNSYTKHNYSKRKEFIRSYNIFEVIYNHVVEKGAPGRYIKAIRDMYERAKTCVRTPVGNTEYLPVEVGLHQVLALSPFLFALILDELSREIQ